MLSRVLFLLTALLSTSVLGAQDFWNDESAEYLIKKMTPSEWVAQVLMYGYSGDSAGQEILAWVESKGIGGIKIFGRNANNLAVMMDSIIRLQRAGQRTHTKIPLIVATDQEGGWVRHVRGDTSQTPGNLAIGASGIPYDSWQTGYYIGAELKELGINMNFAPTVDLYTDKNAHVIGPRSFGEDPVQTALLAVAFFKGQDKAGVISTAKHYPGHGNTSQDSHGTLPVINDPLEILMKRELIPYQFLIKENLPAIMSGHLAFPKVTGNNEPASLSPFFDQKLLRETLGYKNLLITDDLFMEGARPGGISVAKAAERAIRAGNDMLMVSMGQSFEVYQSVYDHLVNLVNSDPQFKERIKEAAGRVILTKIKYLRKSGPGSIYPQPQRAARLVPNPDGQSFFLEQAARSLTPMGSQNPIPKGKSLVLVTCYELFAQVLRNRFPGLSVVYYDYDPFFGTDPAIEDQLLNKVKGYDTVIFNLVTPGSVELLKKLQPIGSKVRVVSVLTPVYLDQTPWVQSALAIYGTGKESFEACSAVLAGDFKPSGKLPIHIKP